MKRTDEITENTRPYLKARQDLKAQRLKLALKLNDLQAIMNARSALLKEVTGLNAIHVLVDELSTLSDCLSSHVQQLEQSLEHERSATHAKQGFLKRIHQYFFPRYHDARRAVLKEKELRHVQERLMRCRKQSDQLCLEMVSRQAFIAETTKQLFKRLSRHAQSFAEASKCIIEYQQQIRFIDERINELANMLDCR